MKAFLIFSLLFLGPLASAQEINAVSSSPVKCGLTLAFQVINQLSLPDLKQTYFKLKRIDSPSYDLESNGLDKFNALESGFAKLILAGDLQKQDDTHIPLWGFITYNFDGIYNSYGEKQTGTRCELQSIQILNLNTERFIVKKGVNQ